MLALLTDPTPPTVVVPPRRLLVLQLASAGVMSILLALRWGATAHRTDALAGAALVALLPFVQRMRFGGDSLARRAAAACCIGAACVLTVGVHGGIGATLAVPVLLAVVLGTLVPGSREIDLGAGAALGALLPLAGDRWAGLTASLGFAVAAVAVAIVVRALERLLALAREEAELDPLTGVLNRAAFGRRADLRLAAARTRWAWGMIMIDLDDFGALNKQRGHLAGDTVLAEAARCLRSVAGPEGLVGRLGGDEFAALVPAAQASWAAHELRIRLARRSEPIRASIGVACGEAPETEWIALLKEADVSLRAAKRAGKGQAVIFAESIAREAEQGRKVLLDMIENDGIRIVAQPIVDLRTGETLAYEALARFDHEAGHGPAHWFALAESLDMRTELELACLERTLPLRRELDESILLTVNLSARALREPRIRQLLLDHQPHSLVVELTEESLVNDFDVLLADLEPLLSSGVKLAVDDMGAGYSNLHQVIALRPSLVKLDRALVHGVDVSPNQFALIDALIGYAQRTGAQIIGEGIESEAELQVLRTLGVSYGQGYLLGRPAPPWPQAQLEPAEPTRHQRGPVRGSLPVVIDATVTSDEARRRFAAYPDLESLVIVDEERRPLGLITRHRLLTMLGHRFGYALWGDKSIMHVADSDCLRVPRDTPADELARRSLARPLDRRHDPVLLVDEEGLLSGHVTMGDMLFGSYLERRGEDVPAAASGAERASAGRSPQSAAA